MAWSGKLLGGLVGGMVGGPLGMGVGAALGHYLADGEGAARDRDLVLLRLEWRHHAFGPSGPGVLLTPVWLARGHLGRDVRVRLYADVDRFEATVAPDSADETCALPDFLVPYARFDGRARVTLRSDRARDDAEFRVRLPTEVRRLGLSGPARLVMALVACARAGDRPLTKDDVRFVRETFTAAHPLDEDGLTWLRTWLRTLRDADLGRLSPEKVADRLARHLRGPEDAEETLLWLMRGATSAWPGEAQEDWIAGLGEALGADAARMDALWAELDAVPGEADRARARAVLGVGPLASEEEVRAAWLRLVRDAHPDRARTPEDAAEATRRTAEINGAYRLLRGG